MEPHLFDWQNANTSVRTPVFGSSTVATSHPLAAQAGIRMLLCGGNAVDAAVATAIALTVVEPTMNGIGGDCFVLVWDRDELHGLNASGRSPRAWTLDMFRGLSQMPTTGWNSVTVPGAVSSWISLSRRFGVLPFAELFEPAIEYAREGFIVPPYIAGNWARAAERHRAFKSFGDTFLVRGRAPLVGEVFRCEAQADTLSEIAETFGESFYRGRLADQIARYARETGGLLTEEDLGSHSPAWVRPVSLGFGDYTLHEIPPNSQGVAALVALALLRESGVADLPLDSAESLDLQLRAMFIAHSEVRAHVADPEVMECDVALLLDDGRLAILLDRMRDWNRRPVTSDSGQSGGDTVYLSAADSSGMMVSFIQSNYLDFGSGIVIPDTGISLQSRGACFGLDPRHPNVVAGGKRPFHTLAPAFALASGCPVMSFGVMGGPMQPQGHVQAFLRVCGHGQNPQAACDAPRWFVDANGEVLLEQGFSHSVAATLREWGYHVRSRAYGDPVFGGGQFIVALPGGYCAASDPRRDGQAVVL